MSGLDERVIWVCKECDTEYRKLKIIKDDDVVAYITLKDKPIFFSLRRYLFKKTVVNLVADCLSNYLICDFCGVTLHKGTSEWKRLTDLIIESIENKELVVSKQ
jgi:hypothetical protein